MVRTKPATTEAVDHPRYSIMISAALLDNRNRLTSRQAIEKYILKRFNVPEDITAALRNALRKGDEGDLFEKEGQSYRLTEQGKITLKDAGEHREHPTKAFAAAKASTPKKAAKKAKEPAKAEASPARTTRSTAKASKADTKPKATTKAADTKPTARSSGKTAEARTTSRTTAKSSAVTKSGKPASTSRSRKPPVEESSESESEPEEKVSRKGAKPAAKSASTTSGKSSKTPTPKPKEEAPEVDSLSALVVVDMQNDFMSGGPMEVPNAEDMIGPIKELATKFDVVIFSQEWHPEKHVSFASTHNEKIGAKINLSNGSKQIVRPDNCIQDTEGAEVHADFELKEGALVVRKGTNVNVDSYSVFANCNGKKTTLEKILKDNKITEIFVCGVATERCVKNTCLDARENGLVTYLITDLVAGIEKAKVAAAMREMKKKNVEMITSKSID